MRWTLILLTGLLITSGCKTGKGGAGDLVEVKPVEVFTGNIALVNPQLKYVVVEGGLMGNPKAGTLLGVYRADKKVGELKVSEQSRMNNYAADIVSGDVKVGDTVRSN